MAETEKDFDHAEGSAEEHASRSESLLREQHYEDAVLEAEMALDGLPFMARAALTRGRGLLYPALAKRDEGGVQPDKELLHEAGRAFMLASFLDSGCEEAEDELEKLQKLKEELAAEPAPVKDPAEAGELDVIIVGAGAAGIGTALMLTTTFGLDPSRVLLVERGEAVGETFRRWPAEMRFISPSFNQQGWTSSFDLNSIAHGTSPAYSLHAEHPSGAEYADYLNALASAAELRVRARTEVVSVQAAGAKGGSPLFSVEVRTKPSADGHAARRPKGAVEKLAARYVVWAAGEFQYPKESCADLAGADLCVHNSRVRSWASLPGDDFVVIGGCACRAPADPSPPPSRLRGPTTPIILFCTPVVAAPSPFAAAHLSARACSRPAGTRAERTRPSTSHGRASAAPCSPRAPRGTCRRPTRRRSWRPTRPRGFGR